MKKLMTLAAAMTVLAAAATDYTWTGGGTDTLWTNEANWDGSGYPQSGDTATLNTADAVITVPAGTTCKQIIVSAAATLEGASETTWSDSSNTVNIESTESAANLAAISGSATLTLRNISFTSPASSQWFKAPLEIKGSVYLWSACTSNSK